ncbi:MAG TPA: hypothetical protein PLU27_07205 [Ginsengibacter sp.]|nr:hypothetical protein [Ginsengibacter sp.]
MDELAKGKHIDKILRDFG